MRITNRLLRSRISGSAKHCRFIDLSELSIDHIEGLDGFVQLRTLKLCQNNINVVCNLEQCRNLWHLDLSDNQVQSLEGLEWFIALGTLMLNGNDLSWYELTRIQHMHVLNLGLHSNPVLQKDPYYRLHVIDCLPNVWMLDGRIVTSSERIQVEQFFNDSALGSHPVRRKLPKRRFTPSVLSQREVNGIYGEKTVHLLKRFSNVSQLNRELDWTRLKYLACNLQDDIHLQTRYCQTSCDFLRQRPEFLEELLIAREINRPATNIILMLLVASLEFEIPERLLQDTLIHAKLSVIGSFNALGFFLLSSEIKLSSSVVLLGAAKVDRDSGENGGFYDKLYLSLYSCVSELVRSGGGHRKRETDRPTVSESQHLRDSRGLLAAEVVQMFCIVPTFFDYTTKDSGVMKVIAIATGINDIIEAIKTMLKNLESRKVSVERQYVAEAELLLLAIERKYHKECQSRPLSRMERHALKTGKCIPQRPISQALFAADFLCKGKVSPRRIPKSIIHYSMQEHRQQCSKSADLGDSVLLGPQLTGRIVSIPEPDLLLVHLPEIPSDDGAGMVTRPDSRRHFVYRDLDELCWDADGNYWRPKGSRGDRTTFHNISTDISSTEEGLRPFANSKLNGSCDPIRWLSATHKAVHNLSLVMHSLSKGRAENDISPSSSSSSLAAATAAAAAGILPAVDSEKRSSARMMSDRATHLETAHELTLKNSGVDDDSMRPNSAFSLVAQSPTVDDEPTQKLLFYGREEVSDGEGKDLKESGDRYERRKEEGEGGEGAEADGETKAADVDGRSPVDHFPSDGEKSLTHEPLNTTEVVENSEREGIQTEEYGITQTTAQTTDSQDKVPETSQREASQHAEPETSRNENLEASHGKEPERRIEREESDDYQTKEDEDNQQSPESKEDEGNEMETTRSEDTRERVILLDVGASHDMQEMPETRNNEMENRAETDTDQKIEEENRPTVDAALTEDGIASSPRSQSQLGEKVQPQQHSVGTVDQSVDKRHLSEDKHNLTRDAKKQDFDQRSIVDQLQFVEPSPVLKQERFRRNHVPSTRWLGEGRDLFKERVVQRPLHVPGWMEGISFRPPANAASSAKKRLIMQTLGQRSLDARANTARLSSRSAPAEGRLLQSSRSIAEIPKLFPKIPINPSTRLSKRKTEQHRLSAAIVPVENRKQTDTPQFIITRTLPFCRKCQTRHGIDEECQVSTRLSDIDTDADLLPYEDYHRLHLMSPSNDDGHL